jgi:hypothetical protein
MSAKVKLHYADTTTTVIVACDENDDDETIIARAWAQARRRGWLTLPMAYQRAEVLERS